MCQLVVSCSLTPDLMIMVKWFQVCWTESKNIFVLSLLFVYSYNSTHSLVIRYLRVSQNLTRVFLSFLALVVLWHAHLFQMLHTCWLAHDQTHNVSSWSCICLIHVNKMCDSLDLKSTHIWHRVVGWLLLLWANVELFIDRCAHVSMLQFSI